MFCQNCGNQVKDEALFCNKCGKQIDGNITRQYVRETPVVPIHIPSSKSVSFFGNKFKNTFLGTNEREHTIKMTVICLFVAGALMGIISMLILMSTKLGIIADLVTINEGSFLNKELITERLREMYDILPIFYLLVIFEVIGTNFAKGMELYLRCKKRDFRKNKRMVIVNSAIDMVAVIATVFIFWQGIDKCIGMGFREDISLSFGFYILFSLIVLMEILYVWTFIKAADCEAKSLYQSSLPAGNWICKQCGAENTPKDLFCKICGVNFVKTGWTCTSCGLLNKNNDLSCKGCGKYK